MANLTPAGLRLLNVVADASSHGVPPGEAAFRAGYKGKGGQPGGGVGRAPQWSGRVLKGMPPGLVRYSSGRLYITTAGLAAAVKHGRQGA